MTWVGPILRARAAVPLRRAQPMRFIVSTSPVCSNEDLSSPESKHQRIISILQDKFQPSDLQVQDVSGAYCFACAD